MPFPRPNVRWLCVAAASAALLVPWSARAQALPDGAGKDVVLRACGVCHPASMVVGRFMNREQWSAEVSKMVQEGAKLSDTEFPQVVDYLAKSFPAGGAAAVPTAGRGGRGGRFGFGMAQPPTGPSPGRGGAAGGAGPIDMQIVDPAAADRGRTVYIAECVTCHGPRARGAGDGVPPPQKGPDLVRSLVVLHDRYGKEIGPFLQKGHPMQSGRPATALTIAQIADLSHFLHQKVADTLRSGPYSRVQNVVTGDARAGQAFFDGAGGCKQCHSPTGDLAGIASRMDPPALQQRFLFPNAGGGRAPRLNPVRVTVTPATGPAVSGVLLYLDDFTVSLRDAGG
ncbi:MAG: cytochrome c, partial [Acidobacteriota bacterium]|nr:cytochrome c [Acidobacteriota bacterium]